MSAPMASACSPAETRQFPTPSALAGGKSKGTGVCCCSAKLPFQSMGGGREAAAIDEGIFEFSCLGREHLHLQRKERIVLAAGVQRPVSSSTSDAQAHR